MIQDRLLLKSAFALKQSYPREILDIIVGGELFNSHPVFGRPGVAPHAVWRRCRKRLP